MAEFERISPFVPPPAPLARQFPFERDFVMTSIPSYLASNVNEGMYTYTYADIIRLERYILGAICPGNIEKL